MQCTCSTMMVGARGCTACSSSSNITNATGVSRTARIYTALETVSTNGILKFANRRSALVRMLHSAFATTIFALGGVTDRPIKFAITSLYFYADPVNNGVFVAYTSVNCPLRSHRLLPALHLWCVMWRTRLRHTTQPIRVSGL